MSNFYLDLEKTAVWYLGTDFQNAELVTDQSQNLALGISGIKLTKPRGTDPRVLASVKLILTNGILIDGTVYRGKTNTDMMTFGVQQRTYQKDDGTVGYANMDVTIPRAISAQILRYAHTKRAEAAAPAPYYAPVPNAPAAPAGSAHATLDSMNDEELLAYMAARRMGR